MNSSVLNSMANTTLSTHPMMPAAAVMSRFSLSSWPKIFGRVHLIVSVVLWYIVDYFYVSKTLYSRPLGFDVEHCYLIHLNEVNDKSPDFKAYESNEQIVADKKELLMRLQRRPEVDAYLFE